MSSWFVMRRKREGEECEAVVVSNARARSLTTPVLFATLWVQNRSIVGHFPWLLVIKIVAPGMYKWTVVVLPADVGGDSLVVAVAGYWSAMAVQQTW